VQQQYSGEVNKTAIIYVNFFMMLQENDHGLCDSNKLLHKRCAKSMGKPKVRLPLLSFSTDLSETQNQERYPGYDPACKIWLMWDDGKGICKNGEFWRTFGSFFFYSSRRVQITP